MHASPSGFPLPSAPRAGLLTRLPLTSPAASACPPQAMLTTRKGNKRFAFYDLKITLAWEAAPLAAAGAEPGAAAEAAEGPAEPAGEPAGEAVAGAAADVAAGGGEVPRVSGEISVAEFGSGSDHEDIELSVTASGAPFSSIN